jgi:hypothetical protein
MLIPRIGRVGPLFDWTGRVLVGEAEAEGVVGSVLIAVAVAAGAADAALAA